MTLLDEMKLFVLSCSHCAYVSKQTYGDEKTAEFNSRYESCRQCKRERCMVVIPKYYDNALDYLVDLMRLAS